MSNIGEVLKNTEKVETENGTFFIRKHDRAEQLETENVKLRKLVQDMLPFIAEEIGLCVTSDCFMFEECCEDTSVGPCPAVGCIRRRALALGIEAPDE